MKDFAYTMIKVGQGTGGGLMKQLMPNAASAWLPYVQVDDIFVFLLISPIGSGFVGGVFDGWVSACVKEHLDDFSLAS